MEFTLADGTTIERSVSECRFEIRGAAATSPVVLGEAHDGALLGAVTLETLGLMLNPLTREILPLPIGFCSEPCIETAAANMPDTGTCIPVPRTISPTSIWFAFNES